MTQAPDILKHFTVVSYTMLEDHWFKHKVFMSLPWIMHSTLVGYFLWVFCNVFFNTICIVFFDVNSTKSLSVEGSVVEKEGAAMTEPMLGLKIRGTRSVDSSLSQCVKLGGSELPALHSDGDVVIGGFFPLHYVVTEPQNSYNSKPQITSCSRCV